MNSSLWQTGDVLKNKLFIGILSAIMVVVAGYFFFASGILDISSLFENVSPEIYLNADNLNNNGNFKAAQELLENEIKKNPARGLKFALADSILMEGAVRGTEAYSALRAREILLPFENGRKDMRVYNLIGYSYEIIGDPDKALGYYNRSLSIDSKSPAALYNVGRAYWFKGDFAKARDFYEKAEKNITRTTKNLLKSKIYAGIGLIESDSRNAENYFLRALPFADSKAFRAEIYAMLSNGRLSQQDSQKAVEYAELAISADPSNENGYVAYAKSVMPDKELFAKNIAEVNEYLLKAIFLSPRNAEAQYWEGKFNFSTGNYTYAINSYQTALALIPNDYSLDAQGKSYLKADIYFDEAIVYMFKNDEKYKSYIKEAFKYNPTKVFYILDNDPSLKKLRTALIESNIFLMAKFKP